MNEPTHSGPVIAVDVGGTAIKGAIVDEHDTIMLRDHWPTPRALGQDAVIDAVRLAIRTLMQRAQNAVAVGLVVPGLVDDAAGMALFSENIGWRDVPFRQLAHDVSDLPVGFGHDVRAAGLAERHSGAARGVDDVLFMPIGTGISGAMVVDGHVIENKYAGEIGHIDVGSAESCACGAVGCLETVASGASIARRYNDATGSSVAGAEEVVGLMEAGDPSAAAVWTDAMQALARALATYTSLLAPELVIVGGGVSRAGTTLLQPLRHRLRELLVWQQEPQLAISALGAEAGCLGAALLARRAILTPPPHVSHRNFPTASERPKTRTTDHE